MYLSRWILEQIEQGLSKAFLDDQEPAELARNIVKNYGAGFLRGFLKEWTPEHLILAWKEDTRIVESLFYRQDGARFLADLHAAVSELVAETPIVETDSA